MRNGRVAGILPAIRGRDALDTGDSVDQTQRNGPDRPDIGGHVVADLAVAAGGPRYEHPIDVPQTHRQAVDLVLDDVVIIRGVQLLADPLIERPELVGTVGVVHAEHGDGVAHGREFPQRPAGHALGGRVRRDDLRVLGLQGLELREEPVIVLIADLGLILNVVQKIVPADLTPKPLYSLLAVSNHNLYP